MLVNDYDKLPEGIRGAVQRYIENQIPPGSFLEAVLCNDLKSACACADHVNRHALFDIVSWFYNYAPSTCWGSPEKFRLWLSPNGSP